MRYSACARIATMVLFMAVAACTGGGSNGGPEEFTAPQTLLRLLALFGDRQVTLETDVVDAALRYNVYWNTSGNVTASDDVIPGVMLPYVHTGLSNGTTYYYRIAAVNGTAVSGLSSSNSATPGAATIENAPVTDPVLQVCIDAAAANENWSYVHEVKSLDCWRDPTNSGLPQISSLSGIEQYKNLIELYVDNHPAIASTGPLDALQNLSSLGYAGNDVADLSFVSTHFNMTWLSIHHGTVSDLAPLRSLAAMEHLYIDNHSFTDLAPLSALTKLKSLSIGHDFSTPGLIEDLTPLANLTGLVELGVHYNRVSDISPLANLTSLELLWLDHDSTDTHRITDFSVLRNFPKLTDLRVAYAGVSTLTILTGMTQLRTLSLGGNTIVDVDVLASMGNLEQLDLTFTGLAQADLASLSGLTKLTYLAIGANAITDLAPITTLTALTELYANDNQIVDVSPAATLTNLTVLDLADNSIGDFANGKVNSLETLTDATAIGLSGNPAMSCLAVEFLMDQLGAAVIDLDGDFQTSPDAWEDGVNCTSP